MSSTTFAVNQHRVVEFSQSREEKLRKEGQLDTMAIHLPGSRLAVEYNVFGLMGESPVDLQRRLKEEEEKIRESGRWHLFKPKDLISFSTYFVLTIDSVFIHRYNTIT